MKRRILAAALTLCLTMSLVPTAAFAVGGKSFDDVNGHWGQASVERWAGYGVFNGDDAGNFNPDKQMTRAEFATMLANMMGYTAKADKSFGDVASDAWYADAILKLAAAGVMLGDNNGNANPNKPISRAEAAVMMCRAFNIQPSNASLNFADSANVADWARGSMAALAEKGMMNGVGNNQLAPLANITRASVAKLVDNMISEYVTESKTISGDVKGIVLVVGDVDVTVKDATLSENLIVAPKAAGAEVVLTGSTKASDVYVDAAANVKVDAQATAGDVQLSAPKAAAEVAGKVDTVATTAAAADAAVTVAKDAAVSKVEVAAPNTNLNVAGKVDTVNVASSATGAEVKTESSAAISNVTTSATDVKVSGTGKVENVTANSGTVAVTTPGTKVENKTDSADNVTANGKPVPPSSGGTTTPSKPSGGGGGGGGNGGTTEPPVQAEGPQLRVTAVSADKTFFTNDTKKASDLGNVTVGKLEKVSENYKYAITGTAKGVTGWTHFSSKTEEQSGFYVPVNVAVANPDDYASVSVKIGDKAMLPGTGDDSTQVWNDDLICRISENKTFTLTVTYTEKSDEPTTPDAPDDGNGTGSETPDTGNEQTPGTGDNKPGGGSGSGDNQGITENKDDTTDQTTTKEGEAAPPATTPTEKTVTYTLDMSGVVCGTESTADVVNMSSSIYGLYTKADTFKENIPAQNAFGSNLNFATTGTTVKVTGSLNYIAGWTGFNTSVAAEQNGYYLPFMFAAPDDVTTDGNQVIVKTGKKEFTIGSLDAESKDSTTKYFSIFWRLNEASNSDKKLTFTVDWDGTGVKYGAATYTIDYSDLTLNKPSTTALTVTPYDYSAVQSNSTLNQYITWTLKNGSSDFLITKETVSKIAKETDKGIVMYTLGGDGDNSIEILDKWDDSNSGLDKGHQTGWTLKRGTEGTTSIWYFWAKGANGSADTVYKATFEVPAASSQITSAFGDTKITLSEGQTLADVVNKAPSSNSDSE